MEEEKREEEGVRDGMVCFPRGRACTLGPLC